MLYCACVCVGLTVCLYCHLSRNVNSFVKLNVCAERNEVVCIFGVSGPHFALQLCGSIDVLVTVVIYG